MNSNYCFDALIVTILAMFIKFKENNKRVKLEIVFFNLLNNKIK